MEYTTERVHAMVQAVPWPPAAFMRIFWIRKSQGSRDEFASQLMAVFGDEAVVAMVLRINGFDNANSVPTDVLTLFEAHRGVLDDVRVKCPSKLTVLILARGEYQLPHSSSAITLPEWFPVGSATETTFVISDLGQTAEIKPANCEEARLDHVSELAFELEAALVQKLRELSLAKPALLDQFLRGLQQGAGNLPDAETTLNLFENHIVSIQKPRGYRPNAAQTSKFLGARMLKLVLNTTPTNLGTSAGTLANCFANSGTLTLKQPFFGILWRPSHVIAPGATNWHGVLTGFFEAYQLMNAAAHAAEFPDYPVALQYSNSIDLRRFLQEAKGFVQALSTS